MQKTSLSRSITVLLVLFLALLGVFAALSTTGTDPSLAQTLPTRTATPSNYLPAVLKEYPTAFQPQPDAPLYTATNVGGDGCGGTAIRGVVRDLSGQPVAADGYRVHVWGTGIDAHVPVGSAPQIGPSGWDLTLSDVLAAGSYALQLERADGAVVSPVMEVQSRADCEQNVIRFDFVQVHEVE